MSSCKSARFTCPQCGHKQSMTIWASVNVSVDPTLKKRVLERDINVFRCEACKAQAHVGVDLMYHDMRAPLLILLSATLGPPLQVPRFSKEYRRRLVRSYNELIEKILIFDAGVDDRLIEIIKASIVSGDGVNGRFTPESQILFRGLFASDQGQQMAFDLLDSLGGGLLIDTSRNQSLSDFLANGQAGECGWGSDFLIDRAYGLRMHRKLHETHK